MNDDQTPILRADATDDDPLEWGTEVEARPLTAKESNEPEVSNYATGGIISGDLLSDAVPLILDNSTLIPRKHFGYECYENGEGGWNFRPIYRSE